MARRKRIKIYWLQFVLAAVWVGVIEVVLGNTIHPEIRRTLVDILVVLTGVLAFEPLGRHIFKYALVAFIASILIQILRKLGRWYMSAGPGFWESPAPREIA